MSNEDQMMQLLNESPDGQLSVDNLREKCSWTDEVLLSTAMSLWKRGRIGKPLTDSQSGVHVLLMIHTRR